MKNIEKYENEISQLVNEGNSLPCAIATVAGIRKEKPCYHQDCVGCHKKCIEWMYSEYKEEILSDDEKEIVRSMCDFIHKFGCTVIAVRKCDVGNGYCLIRATFKYTVTGRLYLIDSPYFNDDMFVGMEIGKEYNLEELGITCPTQKDS